MVLIKSTKDLNSHVRADEDDLNMHYPKGFLTAVPGVSVVRGADDNLRWTQQPRFNKVIDEVDGLLAPPTEIDVDAFILQKAISAKVYDVDTILWQSGSTIRYTFNGGPDLSGLVVGDHARIRLAGLEINNGDFIITDINDGADWIEVTNPFRFFSTDDEASDSPANTTTTHRDWDVAGDTDHVEFFGSEDLWYAITPQLGANAYNTTADSDRIFTGLGWSASDGGDIGGTISAGQVAFGSALDTIAGNANFTYTAGGGLALTNTLATATETGLALVVNGASATSNTGLSVNVTGSSGSNFGVHVISPSYSMFGSSSNPTAMIMVQGENTSGSQFAFLAQNASALNLLRISNNGALDGEVIDVSIGILGRVHLGDDAGEGNGGALNVFVGADSGNGSTGTSNTALGAQSFQSGNGGANIALGIGALSSYTGGNSFGLGTNTGKSVTGEANVFIGQNAGDFSVTGENPSNHVIFGSGTFPLNDIYFGSGIADATVTGWAMHGSGAKGTDIAGGDITFAGGQGTGAGEGGKIIFSTAPSGLTGTSKNALLQRGAWDEDGNLGVGIVDPEARIHIKGVSSTDSTFGLKVDSSGGTPGIYVRDDGNTGIGVIPNTSTNERLVVKGSGTGTVVIGQVLGITQLGAIGVHGSLSQTAYTLAKNNNTTDVLLNVPVVAGVLIFREAGSDRATFSQTSFSTRTKMKLGVSGGTDSMSQLETRSTLNGTSIWSAAFFDDSAFAAGVGGGIYFVGRTNATTGESGFAAIRGLKANAISNDALGELAFYTGINGNTEVLRLDEFGNMGLGVFGFGTDAKGVVGIGNNIAPTTSPGNMFQMYANDIVAGNSAMHIRNENGEVIKLFKGDALTIANGGTVDATYGTEERDVILNLVARQNELEERLQANGLLT